MVNQTVSIPRNLYFEVDNYAASKGISFSAAYAEFARMGYVKLLELGEISKD